MKIGLVTDSLGDLSFPEALDWIAAHGIEAVELSTGGFSSAPHCNLNQLLGDESAREALMADVQKRELVLIALNCNSNPLDPHPERRQISQDVLFKSIELAQDLGLETVVTMSGCPGDPAGGPYPNWVTSPWQPEFIEILDWQWDEVITPFWKKVAEFAGDHRVRIAIEMCPGQAVYNTSTLMRLREIVGSNVGANFDPSHLFFQGIDPIRVVLTLGENFIYHVHAKDAYLNPEKMALNGGLETRPLNRLTERAWGYRTLGHGHGETWWCQFVSALRMVGYDGPLSIEHEDPLMSAEEGIIKSVRFLEPVVMKTMP